MLRTLILPAADLPYLVVEMLDGSVPPTAIRHAEVLVSALLSRMVS